MNKITASAAQLLHVSARTTASFQLRKNKLTLQAGITVFLDLNKEQIKNK